MIRSLQRLWFTWRLACRRATYALRRAEFYLLAERLSKDRTAITQYENKRNALDGRHQPSRALEIVDIFRREGKI